MPDQALCGLAQSVITTSRSGVPTDLADMGESCCRYGQTFEDMYTQMEARQKERQNQMRDQAAQGSTLDKVKQVWLELASYLTLFCKKLVQAFLPCKLPEAHLRFPCSMSCKEFFSSPYHVISLSPTAGSSLDFV